MAGGLVVEGKGCATLSFGCAHAGEAAGPLDPAAVIGERPWVHGLATERRVAERRIERAQGVLPEQMFHVGEQQLLVLLFMLQTELEQWLELGPGGGLGGVDQRLHCRVDVGAKGQDLVARRAGEQPALGTRLARAERLVIGIKEKAVALVEDAVGPTVRHEQQGLEEPAGVGEVPFGWAGIGHGLHALVLRRQRPGQPHRVFAQRCVALLPKRSIGGRGKAA